MAMATPGSIERLIFTSFLLLVGGLGPSGFGFSAPRDACVLCGYRSQVVRLTVPSRPVRRVVRLTSGTAFVMAAAPRVYDAPVTGGCT